MNKGYWILKSNILDHRYSNCALQLQGESEYLLEEPWHRRGNNNNDNGDNKSLSITGYR